MSHSEAPEAHSGLHIANGMPGEPGEAYDALADLFLGEGKGGHAAAAAARARGTAGIELLLLGHLPVLGAAWAMQYARAAAEEVGGPVAVLQVRGGEVSLELVGISEQEVQGALPTLEAGLAAAMQRCGRWLVRVDEASERAAAQLGGVEALTLLTGADEAAIVSAYQMLKDLGSEGPEVRLAIMGAAPEKAAESAERIARTAESHLQRKVRVVACVSRIAGGRSAVLYRGALAGDGVEMVRKAMEQIKSGPVRMVLPRPIDGAERPAEPVRMPEPVRVARPAAVQAGGGSIAQPTLASHLRLDPLPFDCPYAPGVELALKAGGLQLIVHAGQDPEEALRRLAKVQAWAREHGQIPHLAAMGCQKVMEPSETIVMHVVTDQPKLVRPLLDSELRVHLVAAVLVEGKVGWFVTELN